MTTLNVGCGGRPSDKTTRLGDVRIDVEAFPNVTHVMDAHHLAFPNKTFDKVVCYEALEHMDCPLQVLREFRRVLKDDGLVEISVPNQSYWRSILSCLLRWKQIIQTNPHRDHRYGWSIYEFCGVTSYAGFKIVDVQWLDWYPKGKLKTRFLEPLLQSVPQIACMHVMFKLQKA